MLKPLGKRVIIKRDESKVETESGLLIPDAAQKPELSGTVLAVGPQTEEVTIGQRVIFGKFDGQNLDSKYTDEENCIIINEEQIKAIYV